MGSKTIPFKWRISKKEAGMRLLQFLREKCPEAPSVKTIKRAIDGKLCTVNHHIETFSSYILEENDIVILDKNAFEKRKTVLETKIPVLFEDKDLLIINKPAGLISENRALKTCLPNLKETLELVHRLDKETSGVLIVAKTHQAKEKMIALFKVRGVRKLYLAIVDGVLNKEEGKIDNFLGKKRAFQGQTVYGSSEKNKGVRAITFWSCLSRSKTASFVCCEPLTGRTHQLRVHLSEMGHPILGDAQYGKKFICPYKPHRNLLHAYSVVFIHPITGQEIKIIAPIPADFKQALSEIKIPLPSG
jgi:23S rRNA pseudouridine955/2504/2580 synthase